VYTFADPLEHALRVGADRVATVCGDVRHTFAELVGRCRRLGDVLDRLGVGRGERVAIWAGNSHQYVEIYAAVPAHGRVVVPLNTRHAEPELVYALEDAGAGLLLTDREPGKLADCVDRVIRIPDEWEALLAGADEAPLGEGVREDDLAGLFYTGGTTGASKGVMLSHRNLIANTFHWLAALPHAPTDSMLVMAPLFHAAGSNAVLGNLWTGGKQILLPSFDLFSLLNDDASYRPGPPQSMAEINAVRIAIRRSLFSGRATFAARLFVEYWSGPGAWEALDSRHQLAITERMRKVDAEFDAVNCNMISITDYRHLRTPVLLLSGERTRRPAHRIVEMLASVLPHLAREVVRGAGHMGPISHVAEVNGRIAAFLDAQLGYSRLPQAA